MSDWSRSERPGRRLGVGLRGQTEVVGVMLLVAITVLGTIAVVVLGSTALDDSSDAMHGQSAEHTMTQMDAKIAEVALGESTSAKARLPRGGSDRTVEVVDRGWINVTTWNTSTGNLDTVVLNKSLGAIVYENENSEVAYQGGGVWKYRDGGSTMVSPPEFHYRGSTLTLPVVQVTGNTSAGSTTVIDKRGTTERRYPNASAGLTNPLTGGMVNVTVHSKYYLAWGNFFETRTDGRPFYDHDNRTVTATLVVERDDNTVNAGIVSGGGSGAGTTLTIKKEMTADSYNSSLGEYVVSKSADTKIQAIGDLVLNKGSTVKGSLETEGKVTMKKDTLITENLQYGSYETKGTNQTVGGWIAANGSVSAPNSVGHVIDQKQQEYQGGGNDNDGEPSIDNTTKTLDCTSTCSINASDYWLESLTVESGEHIKFRNQGGPVNIYVEEDFVMEQDAKITLKSADHPVKIYVNGDGGGSDEVDIGKGAVVEVENDSAPSFWVYQRPGSSTNFFRDIEFTGVIYGPASDVNDGTEIVVQSENVTIYGALVGTIDSIHKQTEIHYDEALSRASAIDSGGRFIPTVTYLHVTINRVRVEET